MHLFFSFLLVLKHHQMSVKTLRFACENLINFLFIIKYKKHCMISCILSSNPFFDLHNGLKVLIIASMLSAHFVRNFAAITNSVEHLFLDKWRPPHSLSFSERWLQCFVRLSISRAMESHTHVSQNPGKNKPQTLPITVLPLGPKALLEGTDNSTA